MKLGLHDEEKFIVINNFKGVRTLQILILKVCVKIFFYCKKFIWRCEPEVLDYGPRGAVRARYRPTWWKRMGVIRHFFMNFID